MGCVGIFICYHNIFNLKKISFNANRAYQLAYGICSNVGCHF